MLSGCRRFFLCIMFIHHKNGYFTIQRQLFGGWNFVFQRDVTEIDRDFREIVVHLLVNYRIRAIVETHWSSAAWCAMINDYKTIVNDLLRRAPHRRSALLSDPEQQILFFSISGRQRSLTTRAKLTWPRWHIVIRRARSAGVSRNKKQQLDGRKIGFLPAGLPRRSVSVSAHEDGRIMIIDFLGNEFSKQRRRYYKQWLDLNRLFSGSFSLSLCLSLSLSLIIKIYFGILLIVI